MYPIEDTNELKFETSDRAEVVTHVIPRHNPYKFNANLGSEICAKGCCAVDSKWAKSLSTNL